MNDYYSNTKESLTNLAKVVLTIILLSYAMIANAQIPMGVTVNVFPPYPTQYNVWIGDATNYMITIHNNSDSEFEYYIRAGLEGESGGEEVFARISPGFFPSESLMIGPNETQVVTAMDLEDLYRNANISDLERSDNVPLDIDAELPEGTYMLCFELMLYDNTQEVFLSPKICSDPFFVTHNSLQLQYPLDGSTWSSTDIPVTFQWFNNSSSNLNGDFEYELSVYEIDANAANEESIYEFIESGAVPFYRSESTPDLNLVYDIDFGLPEFTAGNLYAARVRVVETGGAYFDGGGISNINTFWFGYNPTVDNDGDGIPDGNETTDCFERCQVDLPANTSGKTDVGDVEAFKMGNFVVSDLEFSSGETSSTLSGIGTVQFSFLQNAKMAVEFENVSINTNNEALTGEMRAITLTQEAGLLDNLTDLLINNAPLPEDRLEQLDYAIRSSMAAYDYLSGDPLPVPFAVSQTISGQTYSFSLLGFDATPERASLDFINALNLPINGEITRIGIGAADVCIAPDGFGSAFKLYMLNDLNIPMDNGMSLTFKGGQVVDGVEYDIRNNPRPCYFDLACEGIKGISLSGNVDFGINMLIKEENDLVVEDESVKGYFSTVYERDFSNLSITNDVIPETDFLVDFVMDDFQLKDLPGYTFSLEEGAIDFSEVRNPQDIEFPEGFEIDGDVLDTWQGFYLKKVGVKAPRDFVNKTERRKTMINHIIIDPQLSMDVEAFGVLPYEEGTFKGWGIGIDTFEVAIIQNTLIDGRLQGAFGTPVMAESDNIQYNFLVDQKADDFGNTYYAFEGYVSPNYDVQIPLAIADATICQSSYLALQFGKKDEEKDIELFAKGDLDINTGNYGQNLIGNARINLADYQIHYNSIEGFISKKNREDGRGTYFGKDNNKGNNCHEMENAPLQDVFDAWTAQIEAEGRDIYSNISENTLIDENVDFFENPDDYLNGFPISFRNSKINIVDGDPRITLAVEARLNENQIAEAGIILKSGFDTKSNGRLAYRMIDVELYFQEGMVILESPLEGAGMAMNEDVQVVYRPDFGMNMRDSIKYMVQIMEVTDANEDNLARAFIELDKLEFIYRSDTLPPSPEERSYAHTVQNSKLSDLEEGNRYAVLVRAYHPTKNLINNGFSNINTFIWGQTATIGDNAGANSDCAERCSPELPENGDVIEYKNGPRTFQMGNFIVQPIGNIFRSGNLISGEGKVNIPFLRMNVKVDFLNVGLNSDSIAVQGTVTAQQAPGDFLKGVAEYVANNSENQVVQRLAEFVDEGRMVAEMIAGAAMDLPLGVQVRMGAPGDESRNSIEVAVTDFKLTPTTSDVDFLAILAMPTLSEGFYLGLGAKDVCIGPDGFGGEALFHLTQDLTIPMDGYSELRFIGGEEPVVVGGNTLDPMSFQIDCNGFKGMNISGSVTYPDDVFLREDILTGNILEGELVKGYFGLNLQREAGGAYEEQDEPTEPRTDFIMNYTMDPFQIKGLDGWGFELTEGVLDLSEGENLAAMEFPEGYDYSDLPNEEFWTGFYLKNIAIRTPKSFTENDQRGISQISNFMIDPLLSLDAQAINMLPIERGSYRGWGVGLDTIELTVLQNSLTEGKLVGKINAPVMKKGLGLEFNFLLQQKTSDDGNYYAFDGLVQPTRDLEIPLAIATASVCQSSYLAFQFDREEEGKNVEIFLKGDMDINTGNLGQNLVGSARLQLADYQMHYNSVSGFLLPEQTIDGRGSYLGMDNSEGNDCLEPVDMANMQDIFDAITEEVSAAGEQVIDAIEDNTQIDEAVDAVRTFNPDDYMGDLPISFSRSEFEVIDGAPKVSLIVEARLAEDNIIEAGMILESERVQNGNSFNFGLSDFNMYFTQGMIQLNGPTNGSSLASDENISVNWEADLPPAQLNRVEYSIQIIEITETLSTNLDSLFRAANYTPFYVQENISGTSYSVNVQNLAFITNGQYAIRIKASDPDEGVLVNDGYSNINIFTWGQTAIVGDNAGNNSACATRCSPTRPAGPVVAQNGNMTEFTIGNFTVSEVEVTGQSGDLINGEGVVTIDFLNNVRLHVTFNDIGLNAANEAIRGKVDGKTSNGGLLETVAEYLSGNAESLTMDIVSELSEEAELIAQVMTSGRVELPFGVNISMDSQDGTNSGASVNANFTDFSLTPTTSDVDFLVMMSFPAVSDQSFGLGAKDICIDPDGFGSEAQFYLASDVVIPLSQETTGNGQRSELTFKGGAVSTTVNGEDILPTYIEIDCDGFKSLNVSGIARFPQSMFVQEDTLTGQINEADLVQGAFSLNLTRTGGEAYAGAPAFLPDPEPRTDMLIEFTMDPFQIKGLDGWGFVVRDAVLDLSESSNANYMSFPQGHSFLTEPNPELWTGFYLGEVSVKSPAKFTEANAQGGATPYRNSVSIYSLLIDPQISVFINVDAEILAYEQASIKEWGISIDNLNLSIVQNTFVSAGLGGVVGSPIIGTDERIPYSAAITRKIVSQAGSEEQTDEQNEDITSDNDNVSYVMSAVLSPPSDMTLPMMAAGFSVCESSYLGIQIGKNEDETQMEIFLKGSINLDLEQAATMAGASVDIPGDFELALADFQVKYNTVDQFIMESDVTDGTGTTIGLGMNSGDVCAASGPLPDLDGLIARGITGNQISSSGSSSGNTDAVADSSMPDSASDSDDVSGDNDNDDEEAERSNMAGFPIRLTDFGIEMDNGNPAVSFTVDLALADGSDGFAAGASLTIHTREARPDRKLKIALDRVVFNCARLAVDMDALTLVGCLCHENDNGVNGYFGKVIVQTNGISLDLAGGFGTFKEEGVYEYGTEDYYGMWYVDGTFSSNAGIPMGPLTLNAFGGGIYWNVEAPELPSHNELEEESGEVEEMNAVSECMESLISAYEIELSPGSGGALSNGSVTPNYGNRSIRVNAGLSLGSPKLAVLDPYVRVDWMAGDGLDMISVGGYLYLLQQDYMSRGAPRAPQEVPEGTTAVTGGDAFSSSKMWMSFFNTITFDRDAGPDPQTGEDRTLVAFEGTGSIYMNMIPEVLMGNAGDEQYRMISHDIYFGHVDHDLTKRRGYRVAGSGNTYWHAYFGNPYTAMGPGRITFDLAGLFRRQSEESGAEENNETTESTGGASMDVTAYMMLGHGIPGELPPVPDMITAILNNTSANEGDEDNGGSFSGASTNDAEERENIADKTSGFAFGTTIDLNMGFDKIIYANLRVILGMDFMIKNTNGTTCISGDKVYSPPGVEGFYGEGQIFAGLEGGLGVRGRVLGRDIEVELMYLAAAMLIEGGGPNPFWIRGRAAVNFRCLGGLIKGNANVDVSAGQPCSPFDADPFSLEIIDKVFPSPDHINSRAVNPYSAVKVSFKMPVADIDNPAPAEITVPVILEDGGYDIVKLAPVISELKLKKKVGENFYDVDGEITYSETGRTVRFIPTSPMALNDQETDNKRHRIYIILKAMEKDGNDWDEISSFRKDSIVAFDAAPLDPYEEYVPFTNPIRGQRYFMADEWDNSPSKTNNGNRPTGKLGAIHFHKNIKSSKFYASLGGNSYKYYAVWKDAGSKEEVDRYELLRSDIKYKKVIFPISTVLEPSTTYILQLVRKAQTGKFVSGEVVTSDSISFSKARGVESSYVIEYQEDDENPFDAVAGNETLIHMVAFATSRYDNLSAKLANIDLTLIPAYTTIGSPRSTPYYSTAHDQVELTGLSESFEKIELKGITTSYRVPGESWTHAYTRPRVQLVDPMEGNYYENEVKPKMNNLLNKFDSKILGYDVGLRKIVHPNLGSSGIYGYGPTSDLITFYSGRIKGNRYSFANNSMVLDDYINSRSFFASPLRQEPVTFGLNSFIVNATQLDPNNSGYRVTFEYLTRENLREEVADLVDWFEDRLPAIKDGNFWYRQSLSDSAVASRFNSTFNAYNDVISSSFYNGNASSIQTGRYGQASWSGFRTSEIDFFYNLDAVTKQYGSMTYYGSKTTRILDD